MCRTYSGKCDPSKHTTPTRAWEGSQQQNWYSPKITQFSPSPQNRNSPEVPKRRACLLSYNSPVYIDFLSVVFIVLFAILITTSRGSGICFETALHLTLYYCTAKSSNFLACLTHPHSLNPNFQNQYLSPGSSKPKSNKGMGQHLLPPDWSSQGVSWLVELWHLISEPADLKIKIWKKEWTTVESFYWSTHSDSWLGEPNVEFRRTSNFQDFFLIFSATVILVRGNVTQDKHSVYWTGYTQLIITNDATGGGAASRLIIIAQPSLNPGLGVPYFPTENHSPCHRQ